MWSWLAHAGKFAPRGCHVLSNDSFSAQLRLLKKAVHFHYTTSLPPPNHLAASCPMMMVMAIFHYTCLPRRSPLLARFFLAHLHMPLTYLSNDACHDVTY